MKIRARSEGSRRYYPARFPPVARGPPFLRAMVFQESCRIFHKRHRPRAHNEFIGLNGAAFAPRSLPPQSLPAMERRAVCAMKCFRKGTSRVNTIVGTANARAICKRASALCAISRRSEEMQTSERMFLPISFFFPHFLFLFFLSLSLSLFFLPLETTRAHSVGYFHNSGNI